MGKTGGRPHRSRFDIIADAVMPQTFEWAVNYADALGGGIFDLPSYYQDAIAKANTLVHPISIANRQLVYLLVSGQFTRTQHPFLAGVTTVEELREMYRKHGEKYNERRREKRRRKCHTQWNGEEHFRRRLISTLESAEGDELEGLISPLMHREMLEAYKPKSVMWKPSINDDLGPESQR